MCIYGVRLLGCGRQDVRTELSATLTVVGTPTWSLSTAKSKVEPGGRPAKGCMEPEVRPFTAHAFDRLRGFDTCHPSTLSTLPFGGWGLE